MKSRKKKKLFPKHKPVGCNVEGVGLWKFMSEYVGILIATLHHSSAIAEPGDQY